LPGLQGLLQTAGKSLLVLDRDIAGALGIAHAVLEPAHESLGGQAGQRLPVFGTQQALQLRRGFADAGSTAVLRRSSQRWPLSRMS
jgi:hypothetical protein